MANKKNTQVIFTQIPEGMPDPSKHFKINNGNVDIEHLTLSDGELVLKTLYLSVDPYMRFRLRDPKIQSYFPAAKEGELMSGGAVCQVLQSKNNDFTPGDLVVTGNTKWENYTVTTQKDGMLIKIPPPSKDIPLSYYLGILGMPGLTAYAGLKHIGLPKQNETIFVSAASGAVGQIVGQYCKSKGLRVVGSAGTDDKIEYLTKELKFDAAFNYKKCSSLKQELEKHCPNGIDIYFENVGGEMLEAVLENANTFARVLVCGMISQYNKVKPDPVHNLTQLIGKRIRMQGFIVTDYYAQERENFIKEYTDLIKNNKIKYRESVTEGIENTPHAFVEMLKGNNFGKQIVKVAQL